MLTSGSLRSSRRLGSRDSQATGDAGDTVAERPHDRAKTPPPRTPLERSRRAVLASFGIAIVLLLLVAAAAALVSYVVAGEEVSADAAQAATRLADTGVGPPLTAALAGDPAARSQLDAVVAARIADGAVSQITVWTPDGVVVYSTNKAIVGRRARSDLPYRTAIARGVYSELDSTDREFGDIPRDREVVEVHVPVAAAGNKLVLELHYNTDEIAHQTTLVALPLIGLSVLPLLLLQATQTPVVLSLLRRVRGYERDRVEVAEYALTASERERRDIAAGVHDTVVQDLAGASYALSALERDADLQRREAARVALSTIRTSVQSLRGLLVELYPETLTATALPVAVDNLLAGLRRDGLATTSHVELPPDVDDAVAVVLYRVIREALTNVGRHARATTVDLTVTAEAGELHLRVADDGVGLPQHVDATGGYRGLALLSDRVADLGGTVHAHTRPIGGTQVDVVLPVTTPV